MCVLHEQRTTAALATAVSAHLSRERVRASLSLDTRDSTVHTMQHSAQRHHESSLLYCMALHVLQYATSATANGTQRHRLAFRLRHTQVFCAECGGDVYFLCARVSCTSPIQTHAHTAQTGIGKLFATANTRDSKIYRHVHKYAHFVHGAFLSTVLSATQRGRALKRKRDRVSEWPR